MSMEINTNTGANSIDWSKILSALGEVEQTEAVDGKQTFNITTNVDGEAKTTTISIPEDLEIPGEVDEGTLQGLIDKLGASGLNISSEQLAQMKDTISQIYNTAAGSGTDAAGEVSAKRFGRSHAMFDIYALMALMIDVAQSQRDATREMRTAENMAVQHSIQNQADQQRDAANIGMIVGLTCGIASAAVSAGTMIGQGISASTQNNIMAQSGADAAKLHSTALQNTDSPANADSYLNQVSGKVGNEVATRVGNDFDAQVNNGAGGNLSQKLENAIEANNTAKQDLTNKEATLSTAKEVLQGRVGAQRIAQSTYDTANTTVEQKQAAYDQAVSSNADEATINNAKSELDTAKAEQATAKTAFEQANKAVEDQNTIVANCQRDVGLANDKVISTTSELAQAKSNYVKTVQDVASQYEEKYQTAVERLNNPPEGANKADLKAAVESAKTDMEMAFAKEAKMLTKEGAMSPSEQKDLVSTTRDRVDTTMDRVTRRADFKAAERKMTTLMGINNINQALGGVLQSVANNLSAGVSSEATRAGAETSKQEEMLDQTKDLFQQEQKLIDQVISLFSSVIQAENQSMRDAIQA